MLSATSCHRPGGRERARGWVVELGDRTDVAAAGDRDPAVAQEHRRAAMPEREHRAGGREQPGGGVVERGGPGRDEDTAVEQRWSLSG